MNLSCVKPYNRMNSKENTPVFFATLSGLTILLFAVLAIFFPYTGDDWSWGSSIGITRLNAFFDNYNGRYLGNFLILAISRSKLLAVTVMALSYYATCWMCYQYAPHKKTENFLLAVVLFFMMPQGIFVQAVVWASGFANYVPSALISVGYLLIVKNITADTAPQYPKLLFLGTFVMGFCGAPFIENIAIFNILLGFAVITYVAVKFKKFFSAHISFLFGAIGGAVWMFSNSAYRTISAGADDYRSVPSSISGLLEKCLGNGYTICDNLVFSNYKTCIGISFLLLLLATCHIKHTKNTRKNIWTICSMVVNIFSLCILIVSNLDIYSAQYSHPIKLLLKATLLLATIAYVLTVFILVQLCVQKERRFRMLLPLYCIPVAIAPLLVVTPIGSRCFYISHFLTMVFAVDLFDYIRNDTNKHSTTPKAVFCSFIAAILIQALFYFSIYIPINRHDNKRIEFAKFQSQQGESTIVISSLPNEEYVWTSVPQSESRIKSYKLFYGLHEDAVISVVSPDEFESYYEAYHTKTN